MGEDKFIRFCTYSAAVDISFFPSGWLISGQVTNFLALSSVQPSCVKGKMQSEYKQTCYPIAYHKGINSCLITHPHHPYQIHIRLRSFLILFKDGQTLHRDAPARPSSSDLIQFVCWFILRISLMRIILRKRRRRMLMMLMKDRAEGRGGKRRRYHVTDTFGEIGVQECRAENPQGRPRRRNRSCFLDWRAHDPR